MAERAAQYWAGAQIKPLLSSFSVAALEAAQAAQPELSRALLLERWQTDGVEEALRLGCCAMVVHQAFLPEGFLGAIPDKPYKLDVAKANMGDKQAMLKVGLEIDKAVEESRRGNASLGNAKMSILMQAAQFKEQMGLKREELNQRLLLGLARTEAFGNGKAVPITIAPGVKIDAKTTTDDQLASMGVQRLAQGDGSGLATFFPADVLQTLRAQTREEVLRKPGKLAMLGPKAMQDEINAQLVPKLQNWLMANKIGRAHV